ncbi:unnamed protein product [Adineta ricciae]|uniref:Uncharacterized protein n=1 Tax=Adineta ricciae TaxID=249248 RepID=A0A815TPG2_ADIRI|nr:unnamed protein product [Adineta ricciae]
MVLPISSIATKLQYTYHLYNELILLRYPVQAAKMNKFGLFSGLFMLVLAVVVFMPDKTLGGCTCDAWCRGRGYRNGICGDGHTCICDGMDRSKCTCDAWCRGRGRRGGVCGDGHTCMCYGRGKRSVAMPEHVLEDGREVFVVDNTDEDANYLGDDQANQSTNQF